MPITRTHALRTVVVSGLLAAGTVTIDVLPAAAQDPPTDEPALVTDRCVPEGRIDAARTRILRGIDARFHRLDRIESAVADRHRSPSPTPPPSAPR